MSSLPARIVLATANPGKVAEITAVLRELGEIEVLPRPAHLPEVEEDASTLEGNARLKAAAIAAATGSAALADDTGLEVAALGGAPGVHSARYAGPGADPVANRSLLLDRLAGAGALAPEDRRARFRTVVALIVPGGGELAAEGVAEGWIAPSERGSGGFGYDTLFVPREGDGRTFAEMTAAEKNAISHRGRALRRLVELLQD